MLKNAGERWYLGPLLSQLVQELHLEHDFGVHTGREGQPGDDYSTAIVVREVQALTHLL